MCFTVEINTCQFPAAAVLINNLQDNGIYCMSSRSGTCLNLKETICYSFDYDNHTVDCVSHTLADIIKQDYLNGYAHSIILSNYVGIDENGLNSIISSVLKYSDTELIISLLKEFLASNNRIHLGGFVLFRMRRFFETFEDEIDFAVDEYIEQQRYNDFVKLLKFFVEIQEPAFDEVNLIVKRNKNHILLDKNAVPIDKALLDHTHCEISTLADCDSYFIINDLISLAPKHITIHCKADLEDDEAVKIIKEIFEDKVKVCYHCDICTN